MSGECHWDDRQTILGISDRLQTRKPATRGAQWRAENRKDETENAGTPSHAGALEQRSQHICTGSFA
jgi:hypothetical protein